MVKKGESSKPKPKGDGERGSRGPPRGQAPTNQVSIPGVPKDQDLLRRFSPLGAGYIRRSGNGIYVYLIEVGLIHGNLVTWIPLHEAESRLFLGGSRPPGVPPSKKASAKQSQGETPKSASKKQTPPAVVFNTANPFDALRDDEGKVDWAAITEEDLPTPPTHEPAKARGSGSSSATVKPKQAKYGPGTGGPYPPPGTSPKESKGKETAKPNLESKTLPVPAPEATLTKSGKPKELPKRPDLAKRAPVRLGRSLEEIAKLSPEERTRAEAILVMSQKEFNSFRDQKMATTPPAKQGTNSPERKTSAPAKPGSPAKQDSTPPSKKGEPASESNSEDEEDSAEEDAPEGEGSSSGGPEAGT